MLLIFLEKSSQGVLFRKYIEDKVEGTYCVYMGQFSHRFKSLCDCMTEDILL